ncbi:hypothetical protein ACMAVI_004749 [Burkholderia cenocepacia]|nr:hypothetical protein [Burkholderia orbicola]MDN7561079.1 hypothetical protein [Burkholderia orbicola]
MATFLGGRLCDLKRCLLPAGCQQVKKRVARKPHAHASHDEWGLRAVSVGIDVVVGEGATIAAASAFVKAGYDVPRGVLLARACRHVS